MANIMSQVKLRNKPSRNGFDLSKRNIFSAKIGELLPIYCKEVLPGDKFNINVKSFTRTMPVNTAAYTRIKEYYDWFFVPTNLLWNRFNTFVTQMTDNVQHASRIDAPETVTDTHPYFTHSQIYKYLYQLKQIETPTVTQAAQNMFGFKRSDLTVKLLDYLGYGDFSAFGFDNEDPENKFASNPALNPFPLLAYQKIYADYIRQSQWEKGNATLFNVDYLTGSNLEIPVNTLTDGVTHGALPSTMFDLRYANWNKDLFTGLLPNSQYGDAATVDLSTLLNPSLTNNIVLRSTSNSSGDVTTNSTGALSVDNNTYWNFSAQSIERIAEAIGLTSQSLHSAFSVLALRKAEALQRWKEITQSQQQDYKNQIEAHFGVSMSDAYSERCRWIGGFDNTIDITEVVNTNLVDGDQQNIADIAGKGVGAQDGYTSFSSDVHGWLMCVYHAVPLLDYSLKTRISRQNLKTKVTDYAIPELDRTGMVSVPFIELTNEGDVVNDNIKLLGYAPRYYDYKTDVDEIHGSARNRNSAWVAPFDDKYLKILLQGPILSQTQPISYVFFKVNPQIMDPIFAYQIVQGSGPNTVIDSTTDSDQLLTNCYFDVKCVRNLDRDGLPI